MVVFKLKFYVFDAKVFFQFLTKKSGNETGATQRRSKLPAWSSQVLPRAPLANISGSSSQTLGAGSGSENSSVP